MRKVTDNLCIIGSKSFFVKRKKNTNLSIHVRKKKKTTLFCSTDTVIKRLNQFQGFFKDCQRTLYIHAFNTVFMTTY